MTIQVYERCFSVIRLPTTHEVADAEVNALDKEHARDLLVISRRI